jgi:hypothetical protein
MEIMRRGLEALPGTGECRPSGGTDARFSARRLALGGAGKRKAASG